MMLLAGTRIPLRRLGQAEEGGTVDEAERDRILSEIADAESKVPVLDNVVARGREGVRQLLGANADTFLLLSNTAAALYPSVAEVKARMSDPDPEFWMAPSAREEADIRAWIRSVDDMYTLVLPFLAPPPPAPPPAPPVPPTVQPTGGFDTETLLYAGAAGLAAIALVTLISKSR